MTLKPMIKNYILLQKLYDALFLSLLRAVKLSFILLCFSVSLNIQASLKWGGVGLFSLAFSEEAALNKEQAAKAVWKIQTGNIGNGSGFFISKNKIVTNFHVIKYAESIGLKNIRLVQEGNPEQLKFRRIVRLSILDDLAVLEIEGEVAHFLNLPAEDVLNSSKSLYSLGYPEGEFKEISQTGIFKEDSFFGNDSDVSGASGSPVLNESHRLAGVLVSIRKNLISFINVQTLRSFIEAEYFSCKSLNVKACFKSSREMLIKSMQEVKEARDYFKIFGLFYRGEGVKRDFFKAKEWLEKSAEQDYAPAQYNLAIMYYEGEGGVKDFSKERKWLEKSAEQDYAPAQHSLALIYYHGRGVKRDFFKAREWMEKSAEQGYSPAHYDLAVMYYYGEGGGQDFFKAREWFEKSAEQGYAPAQYSLALMYYYGEGGGQDFFKAREWFEKSAEQGYAPAQYSLALMYYYGKGGGQDFFKAREWMEKSAEQGHAPAQYRLALMYYYGEGGVQNFFKAREWMEKSAEQGYARAQYWLALMYYYGEGGGQNFFKAREWMEKSAEQGYARAQYWLALMYSKGEGSQQ